MKKIIMASVATVVSLLSPPSDACSAPDKTSQVAKNSFWVGGCDGGAWMQILKYTGKQVHLRIQHEDGSLWADRFFFIKGDCKINSSKELRKQLDAYDGKKLLLKSMTSKKSAHLCTLEPVK